jgi:hypothetical protein
MNMRKSDALDFNLEQEEFTEINFLKGYDVPVVSRSEIQELCDTVGSYLPQKRTSTLDLRFWKLAYFEMTGKSPLFWLCCAIVLCIGATLIQTAMSYFSPFMVMMVLAPVPFLAFSIDMLHYRDPHIVELEMTCRYDVRQLYIAKLLIGMLFNIVLLLPAILVVSSVYANGWRLALCTFTTMFLIGFIALLLIGKFRNSLPLSAFLALWVVTGGVILGEAQTLHLFERISIVTLIVAFVISLILFAIKLINAAWHMRSCTENGGI